MGIVLGGGAGYLRACVHTCVYRHVGVCVSWGGERE